VGRHRRNRTEPRCPRKTLAAVREIESPHVVVPPRKNANTTDNSLVKSVFLTGVALSTDDVDQSLVGSGLVERSPSVPR